MLVTGYASAVAVLTAALAAWVATRRRRVDMASVLLWGLVVVVATVAAVAIGRPLVDLGQFGAINVAFRQVVLGVPLTAAFVAVRSVRRGWRASTSAAGAVSMAVALLLGPLGAYMALIEPNRLVVHRATLTSDAVPAGTSLTIGVITDVQTTRPGDLEQRAVEALMAEQPDLILFPGDLFQDTRARFAENVPALRALLAQLRAPGGVYLVSGDVDTDERLRSATEGTGIRWLSNEIVTADVRGTRVVIGGIELEYTSSAARGLVAQLEARPAAAAELGILLAHRPDAVELLPAAGTRTDLVVSGHTHGGQIVLPFLGPPFTLSDVPRTVAAGGLHQMDDRAIFVGSGVGVERGQAPRMRLLQPPSVAVITVTSPH